MGVDKSCVVCNTVFYVPKVHAEKAITCSVDCSNKHQGRNKVMLVCQVCDCSFIRSPIFFKQKYCSINCRNNSETFKAHTLKIGADQNKNKAANKLEALGYSVLVAAGIDFVRQHVINDKFTVDAFIPSNNTVIQFDGDYWHGKKDTYPTPDKRQAKRMALDISQDAYMKKLGITVIRFWESDFKNIDAVTQTINSI